MCINFGQTVYCTDLSREKFMVYNGENWILHTRTQVFSEVQNKIQEYIDMLEEDLQEKLERNKEFADKFYRRIKKFYIKYYGNKQDKEKEFEEKTDEQLMRFFYSIKEFVKHNYNVLCNKQLEQDGQNNLISLDQVQNTNQISNLEPKLFINNDDLVKKRGRPKKINLNSN